MDSFTLEDRTKLITVVVNLGNLQSSFENLSETLAKDHKEIEVRVRALENFRYWLLGMGVLGGTLVHLLLDKFKP